MREVAFSSLSSGGYQDHNLVESISEDDRATLLPIIKIAFPFLKYPMLDPFSTWEADGNMGRSDGSTQMDDTHIPCMGMDRITHEHQLENLLHNLIQNEGDVDEDGIMQMNDQHSPSIGMDGSTRENKVENSQYYFIQNTDGIKQMDDSHSPSSMGMDGSEHEHRTKSLQYNFILPVPSITARSIHSREQREVEGLQLKPWHSGGTWGRACKLEKVEIQASKVEELLLTHRAEPEASSTITDDKLSLSLASTNSETELHMNASPGMMNLRGYISQEASWMQGQCDPTFDEGSEMAHVGHFCNPSSGGSLLSRSTECGNVVDQPHEKGNTSSEACIRSMPTVASKPKDGLGLAFGLPRGERVQSPSLANSINYCVAYKSHEINGKPRDVVPEAVGRVKWPKFAGWHSGHFDHKRKYGSDCATEYEPRLKSRQVSGHTTQVVSFLSPENTVKEHKPEQCRRSNGKQWRCSRNATSGMLYCELHYDYRRKARGKDHLPKKIAWSDIRGQKSETPDNVQEESQKGANSCSGEIRDNSSKGRQLDVARCRRSDGKLWQCSREVTPGSIYCEHHHHHRRCKKGKRKEVSGFAAVKTTEPDVQVPEAWNVENGINAGNRDSIGTYGQASGSKQDVNGSDQCAVRMSQVGDKEQGHVQAHHVIAGDTKQEIYVPEVCGGGPMPTNIQATESKENGCGRQALQPLQMGAVAGGVTANHGWKCNTNQHACSEEASLCMPSSEGKDSVSGYGQFIEESGSKQAIQAARVASRLIPWNVGCPGDTGLDFQGKESGLLERCHRKDGKKWQCSQLCKPGFVYCERHQGRLRKGRAAVSGQAKFEKPPATGAHAEGFTHQLDEEGCLANSVHGRVQAHKESPQMNDECPQDVAAEEHVLKQCQRKDGKGWQCAQHAKKGFSYCEHHLVYLSRRTGSKLSRKEDVGLHKLATEQQKQEISTAHEPSHGCPLVAHSIQKREISTAFEPLLGSVAHPSATCSILKQEISTSHEPLLGSIVAASIQKQDISTAHEPLLVSIASPSAAHSILKRAISIPQEPVVGSIAHPSAAHSIHEQEIGTAYEPLLSCIAYATSACSIQNQEISMSHEPLLGSNAYPSAVHGIQKQGICTAHKPLLGRFAHPAASHNIQKQGICTACEPILDSIAYPLAARSMDLCKDPKTHGPSHSVKSWSEMLTMGRGSDSDE